MPNLLDGWFCDRAPGAGKIFQAGTATVYTGGVVANGQPINPFVVVQPGELFPNASSPATAVSPVSGLTRAQALSVFTSAVGFDGATALTGLPAVHDSKTFSLSTWVNFGTQTIVGFNPNPEQGSLFCGPDRQFTGVRTGNTAYSISLLPGAGTDFGGTTPVDSGPIVDFWNAEAGAEPAISYPLDGTTNAGWVHMMYSIKPNAGNNDWYLQIYLNDSVLFDGDLFTALSGVLFDDSDGLDLYLPFSTASTGSCVWTIGGNTFVGSHSTADGTAFSFNSTPSGSGLYGAVTEMWGSTQWVDWSITANRYKFHTTDILGITYGPCNLGQTGALPFGHVPWFYLRGGPSEFIINQANRKNTLTLVGTSATLIEVDDPPSPM